MHWKLEDFKYTGEKEGFTEIYVTKVREDLFKLAKVFSESLSKDISDELDLNISEHLLDQVIVDTIEDLKRLVNFHPTKNPNTIKEVAYIAFWWLQRKPLTFSNTISDLKIDRDDKLKLIFVNERFLLAYIEQRIFNFNEDIVCKSPNIAKFEAEWNEARKYILYFLQYRTLSAKSIEAFIATSTLHPVRALTDNFWAHDE